MGNRLLTILLTLVSLTFTSAYVELKNGKLVQKTCIKGNDVIVILDVRTDDPGQILDQLNFIGVFAHLLEKYNTRFRILSYPKLHLSLKSHKQITFSTYLYIKKQLSSIQEFARDAIVDRSSHPDINVALEDAIKMLDGNSLRAHTHKTVLIFSYNRYVPPDLSEESLDSVEEALETPSKVRMAELGQELNDRAEVLIYGIGPFDNKYELYDLASCETEKCIFRLDRFEQLSLLPLLQDCE